MWYILFDTVYHVYLYVYLLVATNNHIMGGI
jgi:hypothetical protein